MAVKKYHTEEARYVAQRRRDREWYARNRDREREKSRRRRITNYGISPEQYDEMVNGGCRICGRTEPSANGWHIDHDHSCCPRKNRSCGQCVRGLLCHACNVGLGQFRDDASLLREAADYLDLALKAPLTGDEQSTTMELAS